MAKLPRLYTACLDKDILQLLQIKHCQKYGFPKAGCQLEQVSVIQVHWKLALWPLFKVDVAEGVIAEVIQGVELFVLHFYNGL